MHGKGREIAWPICIQRRRKKKKKKKRNIVRYPRAIPGSRTLSAEVWPVEEVAGKHRGHGKRSAVRCLVFSRPWNRRSTYTCFTHCLCTLKGWVVLVERRRSRLLLAPFALFFVRSTEKKLSAYHGSESVFLLGIIFEFRDGYEVHCGT